MIQEQFPCEPRREEVSTLASQWVSGDLALEGNEVAFRQITLMRWQGGVGTA